MIRSASALEPRHRIWRQVLEIEVSDEAEAWQMRDDPELRRLQDERLLPIIDRCCSQSCPPAGLRRIESLTVDLGAVDFDHLERDLADGLDRQLPLALEERLRQDDAHSAGRGRSPELDAHLELLAFFALTGRVPWWADATRSDLVSSSLNFLIRHAPRPLTALIHQLVGQDSPALGAAGSALRRLVMAIDDRELAALSGTIGESVGAARQPEIEQLLKLAPERLRHALGQAVLVTIVDDPAANGDDLSLWRRVLARAALELGCQQTSLVETLNHTRFTSPKSLSQASVTPWQAALELLVREPTGPETAAAEPPAAGPAEAALPEALPELTPSDVDSVPIETCGLVLLWPFLGTFFERLELVFDGDFRDPEARHRAVGLLHHVATEEPAAAEYQVTLPKILCGLELEDVFDFGPPISDGEAEACRELLKAVIAHAEILNDMSVPGFRGTFLLRRGVLCPFDGAWLLRVERETYDVVLERFPWGVDWVRLPWMEVLVRVEW